ncbi:Sidoreflexin [Aphelenchoides besseyi]|nr:Sidoreflexin [Aphelenchoides besseyi]KAI6194149.1 Sidoreflexin [Aphelenchoides besseyi]
MIGIYGKHKSYDLQSTIQILERKFCHHFECQVTGMLLPNPSWGSILFWQWANQSHNALVNYSNRNASQAQPFSTYAKAYAAAVSAAMSISAVLTWFIRRSTNLSSTQKMIVQRFVPLPATSLASTLNVICMRAPELKIGITVFDDNGKEVGVSKKAARKAIYETALTRAFLPIPLLLLPPCIMPFFEKFKFVQKSATRHLIVNAIVCTISFGLSLPVALALFPQKSTIRRADVEKELQDRTTSELLYFNKGL